MMMWSRRAARYPDSMSAPSGPPTIRDFMTASPATIEADLSLALARERMFQVGARHLPVVRDGVLVGIVSERDIALVESLAGGDDEWTVERAMTPQPFTCGPDAHLHAVAAEMAQHKYGTAVVVDVEHPSSVVGVFTTTDAMRALAHYTRHTVG